MTGYDPVYVDIKYYGNKYYIVKFYIIEYKRKENKEIIVGIESLKDEILNILDKEDNKYIKSKKSFLIPIDKIDEFEKSIKRLDSKYFALINYVPQFIKQITYTISKNNPININKINYDDDSIKRYMENIKNNLPSKIYNTLYKHQIDSLIYFQSRKGRILLADEQGLGKTIQILSMLALCSKLKPLLIVCPSTLINMWRDNIIKWLDIKKEDILLLNSKKHTNLKDINIISYNLISNYSEILLSKKIQFIACDESHYIKSYKSQRTQAILPIIKNSRVAILASGTPATSRPSELYTQLNALCPNYFPYFKDFGERYCDPKRTGFAISYDGASNLEELNSILSEFIMIRRTKSETNLIDKKKNRKLVYVNLNEDDTKNINELININDMNVFELLKKIASIKIKAINEYINNLLDEIEGEKILIFAHHKKILNSLEQTVKSKNIKYIKIDGSIQQNKRQEYINNFQNDKSYNIAILSIMAAGTGFTLTAANKVIFVELYWNPGSLLQAEDRVYRIGQERDVEILYLITKNTLEEAIWYLVNKKLNVISKTFDGIEQKMKTNNIEEIGIPFKKKKIEDDDDDTISIDSILNYIKKENKE